MGPPTIDHRYRCDVNDHHAEEHRGQPRALELWVGGAWVVGICSMLAAGVLFFAGDPDSGPGHPGLAWPLVGLALVSFITARVLQSRYERRSPLG